MRNKTQTIGRARPVTNNLSFQIIQVLSIDDVLSSLPTRGTCTMNVRLGACTSVPKAHFRL